MSLMGAVTRWGQGRSQLHWACRVFGQGKPDYFSYPSPSCCSEMGDPAQFLLDGSRKVICDGRDIFGARQLVGSPRCVSEESRFGFGQERSQPKSIWLENDTAAVTLVSGVAQCKTSQERRANLMSYKQRYKSRQGTLGLGVKRTVFLKPGAV